MSKTIVNPKKLVRDMVAGNTLAEATQETVNNTTTQGVQAMNNTAHIINDFKGDNLLVYTVTFAFAGRVVDVRDGFVILENSSWVADLGRLHQTLKDSSFNEVEYLGTPVSVNIASIVYFTQLESLPTKTK